MGRAMYKIKYIIISLLSICLHINSQTFITVNNNIYRIGKLSQCEYVAKDNKNIICDCCFSHISNLKLNPIQIIKICSESFRCSSSSSINHKSALKKIKEARINLKAMSIINIDNKLIKNTEENITENDINNILWKLYEIGYIYLPTSDKNNIISKEIGNKGRYTGQLFSVKASLNSNKDIVPLYIIKETKKGLQEIENLYKINSGPLGNERKSSPEFISNLIKPQEIIRIAFDEIHFQIKNRYFSVLQMAPGKSLYSYLKNFGKLASSKDLDDEELQSSYKKIKKIFYNIGFMISKLHQKYADNSVNNNLLSRKTLVHGDLHAENLFYDDINDIVTLIDNETFALSIDEPCSGVNDIVEFYTIHTVKTIAHNFSNQLTLNIEFGIDDRIWHELCYQLFYGYLQAFGKLTNLDTKNLVYDFIREMHEGFSHLYIFTSPYHLIDQRRLKRLGPSIRRIEIGNNEFKNTLDKLKNMITL